MTITISVDTANAPTLKKVHATKWSAFMDIPHVNVATYQRRIHASYILEGS